VTVSEGFQLYFSGAEQRGWQKLLQAEGVTNLGISFAYYHKRVSRKNWELPELTPGTSVLLDSGGFGANKRNEADVDWLRYEEDYFDFVERNIGAIDIIGEFDLLALGLEHTQEMREQFWRRYEEKFMPIWHPEHGQEELEHLARKYHRVGVPGTAITDQTWVAPRVNSLARQWGTQFHGMALTKPEVLRNVSFATAGSTSWLSPSMFGDTQVFDGQKLKRYPKRYKDQSRRRHKSLFTKAGFDADKILADDRQEVLRFTIWSWQRWEEFLAHRRGVNHQPSANDRALAFSAMGPVDRRLPVLRDDVALLPVMGFEDRLPMPSPEKSVRVCSSCYVASSCPAFQPEAECAYRLPIQLRTRDELLTFLHGTIEMQAQRVMFGRFVEELEGGYPDVNLSNEIDRLVKLVKELRDIEDNRDSLKINVEARAGAGMISRIFGAQPPAEPQSPALTAGNGHQITQAQVLDVDPIEDADEMGD
jgi:hypothetical protein